MASSSKILIGLICIAFATSGAALAKRAQSDGLSNVVTGADVSKAINLALASAGITHHVSIDPERKFFKCDGTLNVTPLRGEWTTARVECPQSWVRHVRTGFDKRGGIIEDATVDGKQVLRAVLVQSVRAGDLITSEHVALKSVSKRAALGAYSDPQFLVGRRFKVALGENSVIQARHLHPDWMVLKDQLVEIEYHQGHISVVMQGKALENGQFGDMIEVENLGSGEIMNFFVVTAKKVAVRPKMAAHQVVNEHVGD